MTFSLVARCEESGMFGIAVSSSSPAVAARCSHVRAGVGAVASQNITDPMLGKKGLDLLQNGMSASEAIASLLASETNTEYRQILIVDINGQSAIHSGHEALGIWTQAQAQNVASAGNLLASKHVPQAIVDEFSRSSGHLGDRLISAMRAGLAAGGEVGPVHSAGLKVVDKVAWPVADIRCDWTQACPIDDISRAWEIYKPQLEDYVQRAINPRAAPNYGVPGDE